MPHSLPPQVSLRAFREWRGLTLDQLADGIRSQGVQISTMHVNNVELGHKQTTPVVLDAWARVLGINPLLIRTDRQVRQFIGALDAERVELEPAA